MHTTKTNNIQTETLTTDANPNTMIYPTRKINISDLVAIYLFYVSIIVYLWADIWMFMFNSTGKISVQYILRTIYNAYKANKKTPQDFVIWKRTRCFICNYLSLDPSIDTDHMSTQVSVCEINPN